MIGPIFLLLKLLLDLFPYFFHFCQKLSEQDETETVLDDSLSQRGALVPTDPVLSNFQLCNNQLEMAISISDAVIHFVAKLHLKLRDEELFSSQELFLLILTHMD